VSECALKKKGFVYARALVHLREHESPVNASDRPPPLTYVADEHVNSHI